MAEEKQPIRWKAMSFGRRAHLVFMWLCTAGCIVFAGGSIIYDVFFRPLPQAPWSASECEQHIAELDTALRNATAQAILHPDVPPARATEWDHTFAQTKSRCGTTHGDAISRLDRLRYAHEAMLERFALELAPLHVAIEQTRTTHDSD